MPSFCTHDSFVAPSGMSMTPVHSPPSSRRPRRTLMHASIPIPTGVSPCSSFATYILSSCAVTLAPEAPDGTKWYVVTLSWALIGSDLCPGSATFRYVRKRWPLRPRSTHILFPAPGGASLRAREVQRGARPSRWRPLITHHVFITSMLLCLLPRSTCVVRYVQRLNFGLCASHMQSNMLDASCAWCQDVVCL